MHNCFCFSFKGDVKFDDNGTRIYPNVSVLQHQREGVEIMPIVYYHYYIKQYTYSLYIIYIHNNI